MSPKGREQILRLVGPGEAFNEIGGLLGSSNLVMVIALERSIVLLIIPVVKQRLLEGPPFEAKQPQAEVFQAKPA